LKRHSGACFELESGFAFCNGEARTMITTGVTMLEKDESNDQEFEELLRRAEAQWQTLLRDVSARCAASDSLDIPSEN
jgi:hypothetical protein